MTFSVVACMKGYTALLLLVVLSFVSCQIESPCAGNTCVGVAANCSQSQPCASGLQCFGNKCIALKLQGIACLNDNECLSNICNFNVCASTLLQAGMACANSYDCWSGNCVNGRCKFVANGGQCQTYRIDCQSDVSWCNDSICAPRGDLGASCANMDTQGNGCKDGMFCDCGDSVCSGGTCKSLLKEGESCSTAYECLSGVCETMPNQTRNTCVAGQFSVPVGGTCSGKRICAMGSACVSNKCVSAGPANDQNCTTITSGQSRECPTGFKCSCNQIRGGNSCLHMYTPEIYTPALGNDPCRLFCTFPGYYKFALNKFYFDPTESANEDAVYLNPYFQCLAKQCYYRQNDICAAYSTFLPRTQQYASCRYNDLTQTMNQYCNPATPEKSGSSINTISMYIVVFFFLNLLI